MLKKILFSLVALVFILLGAEYAKHYFLLGKITELLEDNGVTAKNLHITYSMSGFRLHADGLQHKDFEASQFRVKIPFGTLSSCRVRVLDLSLQHARIKHIKAYLHLSVKQTVDVEFYRLSSTTINMLDKHIFVPETSGMLFMDRNRLETTLFSDKVEESNDSLFSFAASANLTFPHDKETRDGILTVRVSNFKNLLRILTQGKVIESWQGEFVQGAFGDNIKIPFDIKGKKIFLGPLKLYELEF